MYLVSHTGCLLTLPTQNNFKSFIMRQKLDEDRNSNARKDEICFENLILGQKSVIFVAKIINTLEIVPTLVLVSISSMNIAFFLN